MGPCLRRDDAENVTALSPFICRGIDPISRRFQFGNRLMTLRLRAFAALALALALSSSLLSATAQERRVPASPAELKLSFAPVVQRAAPAVVNVYAAKTVAVQNPLFDDPIFRRFFGVPGAPGGEGQPV